MLMMLSPSKTLDFQTPPQTEAQTQPAFLDDARALVDRLRGYTPQDLAQLMGIREPLAELNAQRFQQWSPPFTLDNAKQAVLAFKGDVYDGLAAEDLSEDDLRFAQEHLRILSGLYGLLRPLDLIQPYRLEMGTKLPTERGKNLYAFWGDTLAKALDEALAAAEASALVNLASSEYFKAVKTAALSVPVVTPVFKERKNGEHKTVAIYAKKARGLMARYAIVNRISDPDDLKQFDADGYRFTKKLSSEREWVFTRKQP